MKGSALAFSFVTLFAVIGFALVVIGISIDYFTNEFGFTNRTIAFILSILVIILNVLIVYGLKRRKIWAIFLGTLEMMTLMILAIIGLVINGLSVTLVSSFLYLSILCLILSTLWKDYWEFKLDG